jgi:dephospho-CoA kinase
VIVVGLTGGIGSGKSTVAARLAARGAEVIDLDAIARQVAAPGGAAYQALVDHFGAGVVTGDGALDRAAIARRAFADPAELAALNAITHPAIVAEAGRRLAAVSPDQDIVVVDVPLLDAASRQRYGLDAVVVVDAPVETAIRRLVEQRGFDEADARARIAAQMSGEDRRRLADFVVDNRGSLPDLDAAVDALWEWLRRLSAAASR